ncbi:MAG: DUF2621 family protein [Patescibacteria group bacterium]
MHIIWASEVEDKLRELLADTPPAYRKYLDPDVRECAELHAHRQGKSEVDEDAMIRGYITTIPRHLRDGIHEILGQHNIDIQYYRPVFDEPNPLDHNHVHKS